MKSTPKNKSTRAKTAPAVHEVVPDITESSKTEEASSSLAPITKRFPARVEIPVEEEIAQWATVPTTELVVQALVQGLEFWMEQGCSVEEAFDRVHGGDFGSARDIAKSKSLSSFDWDDMRRLEKAEAGSSEKMREVLLRQARAELKTGRRGARAVASGTTTPLDEARYLALVEELSEGWNPRNGIERTLIEQMAQAHLQYLHWQMRFNKVAKGMPYETPKRASTKEPWLARVTQAEAANQAANMADRYQRTFLRTQRALRDLRRHSVTIERVDQLNMGEQQVNIKEGNAEGY